MGLLKNIKIFKSWGNIYLTKYGLLHDEFICKTRTGQKFLVRPWTADMKTIKSVFAKKNYVNEFVDIMPNSIVVDVGANIGAFTIFAAQWAKQVFAFEPEPENFHLLCSNIELNGFKNVIPSRMAIAKKRGKQDFYIAKKEHSSSHSFFLPEYEKKIKVQTLSIMDVIERESLAKIDFLKLDCEGSENDIIEGLSFETAKKIEQISLEFHQVNSYSAEDLVEKLTVLGFDVRSGGKRGYFFARRNGEKKQ